MTMNATNEQCTVCGRELDEHNRCSSGAAACEIVPGFGFAIARLCEQKHDLYESLVGLLTWIQTECPNLPRPDDAWGKSVMFRSQAAIDNAEKV